MEKLSDGENINRTWENNKENIKISAKQSLGLCELKQHKQWSNEERLRYLDQRKHAKTQWVLDPKQSNVDNLHNVRCEASRYFRNKKKEYLKDKSDELETNSNIKNIRDLYGGIIDSKEGYQPRTNIVWDEMGDLVQTPTVL